MQTQALTVMHACVVNAACVSKRIAPESCPIHIPGQCSDEDATSANPAHRGTEQACAVSPRASNQTKHILQPRQSILCRLHRRRAQTQTTRYPLASSHVTSRLHHGYHAPSTDRAGPSGIGINSLITLAEMKR